VFRGGIVMERVIETRPDAVRAGGADGELAWRRAIRWISRCDVHEVATAGVFVALVVIALATYKSYAISNDEAVQHHYGELIIAYYTSGFSDQSLFSFNNLYLYGGLFDVIVVALGRLIPIDPYDLRHILCALIGIAGIGAAAATARLIAGPRAALFAAVGLGVSGTWYGTIFNHTKDIPFAAAMMGATLFLMRIARSLPTPRSIDIIWFGVLAGAALGMRVLGLLLLIYAGLAIVLYLPRPWFAQGRWRLLTRSSLRLLPALLLAYVIMILAWPWAALAPLNPVRGLLAFSEFQYPIRTLLAGKVYDMANVPRLYVPIYILIRTPLLTLFGAALAVIFATLPRTVCGVMPLRRRDIFLVALLVIFPLGCQVAFQGPAFTGLRHFLFVIPPLTILAAIGLDTALTALARRGRVFAAAGLAAVATCFAWNAVTLVRLHPYEYLFYNTAVGGLEGAARRYELDYWFGSMPEALNQLEAYLRRSGPPEVVAPSAIYSVAVCGERPAFEKSVTLQQLRWDFKSEWDQSDFFIAPTHMNCDGDLDGKVIGTVERMGVTIAYIKDRRGLIQPVKAAAR
jgi:hypothetical protein